MRPFRGGASEAISSIAWKVPFTTIAYDFLGNGLLLDYTKAAPAAARGITSAHFVSHSMGGTVATLAALLDPKRVTSLTLLASGGHGPEINGSLLRCCKTVASR